MGKLNISLNKKRDEHIRSLNMFISFFIRNAIRAPPKYQKVN